MTRAARPAELPENQLTMLCRHVFLGERPVCHLEPTDEGILVAACGAEDHGDGPDDWLSGGWGTLAARDTSLRDCPPIPLGQAAERADAESPWELVDATPGAEPQDEP